MNQNSPSQNLSTQKRFERGFTLWELVLATSILAIIGLIFILTLNPAEKLKESRDTQRITDLATLAKTLDIYVATLVDGTSATGLDPSVVSNFCTTVSNTEARISYSKAGLAGCTADVTEGSDVTSGSVFSTTNFCYSPAADSLKSLDNSGWVPLNLTSLAGGSPISSLPLDPMNSVSDLSAPTSLDFVYRYACQGSTVGASYHSNLYELNAVLESARYTSGPSSKMIVDGGDNDDYYEVGSSLRLIGEGTHF